MTQLPDVSTTRPAWWPTPSAMRLRYFPTRFSRIDLQLKARTCQAMNGQGLLGTVRTGLCRLRDAHKLLHGVFGCM